MKLTGGCLCGGTRYELYAVPEGRNDCHCVDCRRSSGAPYVTWGSVRKEHLTVLQGELNEVQFAGRCRYFARCCGTHLFFRLSPESEWIDVTIASLDEPMAFGPEKSIWTEDRLPWAILDSRLPAFRQESQLPE